MAFVFQTEVRLLTQDHAKQKKNFQLILGEFFDMLENNLFIIQKFQKKKLFQKLNE